MAEWFKAAVLKTVERKLRGFESYSLRQFRSFQANPGEMAESAEGARLLSECRVKSLTEGSNPSLSATISSPTAWLGFFAGCEWRARMAVRTCRLAKHGGLTYQRCLILSNSSLAARNFSVVMRRRLANTSANPLKITYRNT
jgi:hypothetical protein